MKRQQLTIMEKARAGIVKDHVFWACLMLHTKFVEDKSQPTAWTDMTRIGYNPDFIESLDVPTGKYTIVHELWHIIGKHGLRRGGRDPGEWNICCDHVINIMLKDQGFSVWRWALCDYQYRGMTPEQVYQKRQQERPKQEQVQGGDRLSGDLRPPPVATSDELAKISHDISKSVAAATAMAQARGCMPGNLDRIIAATYEDPVPWEQILVDYMTCAIAQDENWSRRNRRYSEVVLPSHLRPGMAEMTVIADSSGSMYSKDVFERIAVAVNRIVTVVKPMTVRVVWADAQASAHIDIFEPGDKVVLHPKGGGSTDMRLPLAFVEQFDPEVVLLLTDGYTPWPEVPPPWPLIVGCTTEAECPNYARTVRITVGE